jgi:hypothetical protein
MIELPCMVTFRGYHTMCISKAHCSRDDEMIWNMACSLDLQTPNAPFLGVLPYQRRPALILCS